MKHPFFFVCTLVFLAVACQKKTSPPVLPEQPARQKTFAPGVDLGEVQNAKIDEASGLVASQQHAGTYWTHNDSGDKARIFAVSETGQDLGTFLLEGITLNDHEDIALGKGSIFLGDFGDNRAKRSEYIIYHFPEPSPEASGTKHEIEAKSIAAIRFRYPDGARDAETLLYDPWSDSLFVLTKREQRVRLYRLPSQSPDPETILTAVFLIDLPYHMSIGGDISADGSEILIKSYQEVFYWKRPEGMPLATALQQNPEVLDYDPEPQGESIAWKADGSGFFTVSEERHQIPAQMRFYARR